MTAAEDGRLAGLKGFSKKTEENVLKGVQRVRTTGGRVRIDEALDVADGFLDRLGSLREVQRIATAGSLRRMAETIGDVGPFLVASDRSEPVMGALRRRRPRGPGARQGGDEVVDRHPCRSPRSI